MMRLPVLTKQTLSTLLATVLVLSVSAGPAFAHTPSPGLKGFWAGVLHPLTSPAQIMLLLGVSLWAGQQSLDQIRRQLLIAAIACIVGFAVGLTKLAGTGEEILFGLNPSPSPLMVEGAALSVAIIGALFAALLPKVAGAVLALAAMLMGVVTGLLNVPDPGSAAALGVTIFGSFTCVLYIGFVVAGGIDYLRNKYGWPWLGIAVRTVSAWVAAISLLLGAQLMQLS